jgi:hypothetical protein
MNPSKVTIFTRSLKRGFIDPTPWEGKHFPLLSYETTTPPEKIAGEAFYLTNAPEYALSKDDLKKTHTFHGPSLSIGDIVQVEHEGKTTQHLCQAIGWDTREIDAPWPTVTLTQHNAELERPKADLKKVEEAMETIRKDFKEMTSVRFLHIAKTFGERESALAFHDLIEAKEASGTSPFYESPHGFGKAVLRPEKLFLTKGPVTKELLKKEEEHEKSSLVNRIRTLLNDYRGDHLDDLPSFFLLAPKAVLKDFSKDLEEADGPKAKEPKEECIKRALKKLPPKPPQKSKNDKKPPEPEMEPEPQEGF